MSTPFMDASAIQRGLEGLGGALQRQKAILDEQQGAQAALRVQQKLSDKINELSKSADFSGDWGQVFREAGAQISQEEMGSFTNADAGTAFQTRVRSDVERQVNGFRELQAQKMHEWNVDQFATGDASAKEMAVQDFDAARNNLVTRYGAITGVDEVTGAQTIKFSESAISAFGSESNARKAFMANLDGGAEANLAAQIEAVRNGKSSWADKQKALVRVKQALKDAIAGHNIRPSTATLTKMDATMAEAQQEAAKEAFTEMEGAQLGKLFDAEGADVVEFSNAKYYGAGFVPARLRAMEKDPNLTDGVRAKLSDMIAKYTREIPKATDDDPAKKTAKVKAQQDVLMALAKSGATEGAMTAAVNSMSMNGYNGITLEGGMTYAEAQKYASGIKGLVADKDVAALAKEFGVPETLESRFAEGLGGILNGGKSSYIKDGVIDKEKARAMAKELIAASDAEYTAKILKGGEWWGAGTVTANKEETGTWLDSLSRGAGLALFDVTPDAKHPKIAPFMGVVQSAFTALMGRGPEATAFNTGDRRGTPQFLLKGAWYEAAKDPKTGGVTFNLVPGTAPKSATQPARDKKEKP